MDLTPALWIVVAMQIVMFVLVRSAGRAYFCRHCYPATVNKANLDTVVGQQTLADSKRRSVWWSEAYGKHQSQHVFDPYTLIHFNTGIVTQVVTANLAVPFFCWLNWQSPSKAGDAPLYCTAVSLGLCLVLSEMVAATWEIVENSQWVLNTFRQSTLARGYFGDSVINAFADVLVALLGTTLSFYLRRAWLNLLIVAALELTTLFWFRESFCLQGVLAACPTKWKWIDALFKWQSAADPTRSGTGINWYKAETRERLRRPENLLPKPDIEFR